jgi:hypothetical protein
MALCVRRTHRERTLREDWPVVDGNWRHTGAEEIPCEQVRERRFLGSGVLAKQLRSRKRGMGVEREREREREREWDGVGRLGEQGQCQECTRSKSWHQNVRKNAAHKESSRENLTTKSKV